MGHGYQQTEEEQWVLLVGLRDPLREVEERIDHELQVEHIRNRRHMVRVVVQVVLETDEQGLRRDLRMSQDVQIVQVGRDEAVMKEKGVGGI